MRQESRSRVCQGAIEEGLNEACGHEEEPMNRRCCVIRDGCETYVPRIRMSPTELAEVMEREASVEARQRFAIRLRKVRKAALDAKLAPLAPKEE